MKKFVKTISLLMLICVLVTGFNAQFYAETVFTADGFSYTELAGGCASLCDWEGGSATLRIPNKLNDNYVQEIAGWSFSGRTDFSELDLTKAEKLQAIGTMAFKNCSSIAGDLTIPPQIKTIKLGAFQGCSSLNTVYYNSKAAIPEQEFYMCTNLETVVLDDGVSSIGRLAFAKCENLSFIRIPTSVTDIKDYAFDGCENVVFNVYRGSYAKSYAEANGIKYKVIDPLMGDANIDGEVDIRDVTAIQKYLVDAGNLSDEGWALADVNRDGDVTIRDATLIQMKIVGLTSEF